MRLQANCLKIRGSTTLASKLLLGGREAHLSNAGNPSLIPRELPVIGRRDESLHSQLSPPGQQLTSDSGSLCHGSNPCEAGCLMPTTYILNIFLSKSLLGHFLDTFERLTCLQSVKYPRQGSNTGSRFYGKTKEGEFMPESDALDRGYSPAG
jgi:hypothetical protein